jgi:hypothetical protein
MRKYILLLSALIIIFSECESADDDETQFIINTTSEKAAVKTARELSRLFKNNYFFKGIVIQVEDHPISWVSSSGLHAITYHVEYKLDGPLSPCIQKDYKRIEPKKYIVPITLYGMKPQFKVSDEVEITGWIENSANNEPDETKEVIKIANEFIKSLDIKSKEYKLVGVNNLVISGNDYKGERYWKITYKSRNVIDKGKGGEIFIEVDFKDKKAKLLGYGE